MIATATVMIIAVARQPLREFSTLAGLGGLGGIEATALKSSFEPHLLQKETGSL